MVHSSKVRTAQLSCVAPSCGTLARLKHTQSQRDVNVQRITKHRRSQNKRALARRLSPDRSASGAKRLARPRRHASLTQHGTLTDTQQTLRTLHRSLHVHVHHNKRRRPHTDPRGPLPRKRGTHISLLTRPAPTTAGDAACSVQSAQCGRESRRGRLRPHASRATMWTMT